MLTIRMQRTGRKGHAMFRVVVQDARLTPTSGKVVALLGAYDPHAKTSQIDKTKASFYLEHGARPSPRVVRLLQAEKVALPAWVRLPAERTRTTRHPEKLRANQPKQEAPAAEVADTAAEPVAAPVEPTEAVAPAETETTEPAAPADTKEEAAPSEEQPKT